MCYEPAADVDWNLVMEGGKYEKQLYLNLLENRTLGERKEIQRVTDLSVSCDRTKGKAIYFLWVIVGSILLDKNNSNT